MAKHLSSNNADDFADDDEKLMDLMPGAFTLFRQDLEGVMHPNLGRQHFKPSEQSHKRKSGDLDNRNIDKENKGNTNAYDRKKKKFQSRGSGRFVKPLHFQVSNKVLNSNNKNKPGKPMSVEHFWVNEEKKNYAEKFIRRLSSDIGSQMCTQESTTLGGKRRGSRKVLEKVNVEFTDIDTETLIEEEEPSLISHSNSGKGISFENQALKFQEDACRNPIQSSESNLRLRIAKVQNTASLPLHGEEVLVLGCSSKSNVLYDNGSDTEVSENDSPMASDEAKGTLESQAIAESSQPYASKDILVPPKERENNAEELKILKHQKRGRQREVEEDPGLQGAGMTWENGTRRSTRMKYKPLDYWRGERLIYGRIHKSVCTLIAVKYTSPVNVWAKTRGCWKKFKIDSLVSDEYQAMVDILA